MNTQLFRSYSAKKADFPCLQLNENKGSDPRNIAGDWIRAWRFDSLGGHCFKLAFASDHKVECEVGEQKPVARKQKFSDQLLVSNSYGYLIIFLDLLFASGIAWKQRDSNSKKESAFERLQWRHPDLLTKAGIPGHCILGIPAQQGWYVLKSIYY